MFWSLKCTKPAQGQKNESLELQSPPNLHRDKKNKKNKNFTIYLGRGDYPSKVFVFFCFFCPCAGLVHFEVQNFCFFCPCAGLVHFEVQNFDIFVPVQVLDRVLDFKVHQTCTGTKKTKVLKFKVHQTCTRTKKTKVLNFKVHQTCTGTKKNKKNKNFTIYLGRGDYPSKVFVFFVPVQVWCTLKFKTFVFFVPVQVWCTLKFNTLIFLSLCRFGALWSSKPNAFVHLYFDIVSIACRYSWRILHFLLPMQLFEGSGAFFMQRVYNLKIDLTLFKKQILFSGNWCFCLFEMSLYLKSYAFRMHFLPVFAVFLNMWSYWLYSYLVWWPPPQELESGWPYIYIYMHKYIDMWWYVNTGSNLLVGGLPVLILIIAFVTWSGAKVAFAFICEDHLWNITTGCVKAHVHV